MILYMLLGLAIIVAVILLSLLVYLMWFVRQRGGDEWIGVLEREGYLDEIYSKAAAQGDKLEHLSKKKRQQIRGVDLYQCTKCGVIGPPWSINRWVRDLDTVEEDVIPGGCKCGGTVVLIDD